MDTGNGILNHLDVKRLFISTLFILYVTTIAVTVDITRYLLKMREKGFF